MGRPVLALMTAVVLNAAVAACGNATLPGSSPDATRAPTGNTEATTTTTNIAMVTAPLSTFPSITVSVPVVTPPDEVLSDSNGERCLKPYEEITISPTGTQYRDYVFDLGVSPGQATVSDVAASNPAIGPEHILCYFPDVTAR